jgi:hypothetical protein
MDIAALLRATASAVEDEAASLPGVTEAGRVFSSANEQALRAVATAINALLAQVQQSPVVGGDGTPATPAPTAVPVAQAAAPDDTAIVQESVVPLSEAAKGGKGLIKVIDPGWGTSGFYSPAVLERDAPLAFPAGTKMYWDHPTLDEARQRPERSLRDLAALTTGPAAWMKDGPEGPAVYAPVDVLAAYRPSLDELKDDIGVSIRASAHVRNGEADGRKGPLVERLLPGPVNSIDFVTTPGRGGRIAALFEAARGRNIVDVSEGDDVSAEELKAAQEAQAAAEARAATAEAAVAVLAAREVATTTLAGVDIPEPAREAIMARVLVAPPMKDGALDREAFTAAVTEAATAEKAYIDRLTGRGEVRGMGSGTAAAVADPAILTATFQRLGLSESAAKTAATGRRA